MMGVFRDMIKFGSTAAHTGQNKGKILQKRARIPTHLVDRN